MTGNFEKQDTSNVNWGISQAAAEGLKGYRNIAIPGSDARKGEGYDGSRTDAIIILSIPEEGTDVSARFLLCEILI